MVHILVQIISFGVGTVEVFDQFVTIRTTTNALPTALSIYYNYIDSLCVCFHRTLIGRLLAPPSMFWLPWLLLWTLTCRGPLWSPSMRGGY